MDKPPRFKFIAALSCLTATVYGGGFQLYNEGSAEALGQASAISARTDLTSLAWYNPAGLAGTKQRSMMTGNTFALLTSKFEGTHFNESASRHWRSIPHTYYVQPIDDTKTFTLSINTPYGLVSEWPRDGVLRNLSEKAEIMTIYITPSFAVKLTDKLAASVGINTVYGKAKISNAFATNEADGMGLGSSASLQYQPTENWSLGARYQTQVAMTLKGKRNGAESLAADATMPDTLTLGVAYTGLEKWTFGLDAIWTDWSDFNQLQYEFSTHTETIPQNWDQVWGIHLGAEYLLNENWIVRGGYVWDQSPVSKEFRSPMLPGSDRQLVTSGFGYTHHQWTLDVAYSYVWAKPTQQGTAIATLSGIDGTYETSAHLISCSIGYRF